nr:MaoC family dehydratase N-terminal domain-containing protein [Paraburkholderia domus]
MAEDELSAFPRLAMASTLDVEDAIAGAALPPLWHWLYFLPVTPLSQVGVDGHPRRGGFLPPAPLPRRMWAGGRLSFHAPLVIGERASRTSTIVRIEQKAGRSGQLVFVTVRHRIEANGELKIEEEQDIVYRDAPQAGAPVKAPEAAPTDELWQRTITADPVLLFRYSALTFNGHRIHYDAPYATREEGYPDLVVHGPLIATMLAGLVREERPDAGLRSFSFAAVHPTFAGNPFTLCGKPSDDGKQVDLWARDHHGHLTMRAAATLD